MNYEIIHKPTFTNQLLGIPKEYVVQILEKIEFLRDDPKPKGNLKKKLHGYKEKIYRLRSGVYRIIYTYGDGWVILLGVDARKDVYKGSKLVTETTELDVNCLPDVDGLLTVTPSHTVTNPVVETASTELPVQLTDDLLKRLFVPEDFWQVLKGCRTLDDLTNAEIPDEVRDRVFDCVAQPNFDRVLNQPDFITGSTDDLLKFTEGELLGFLLKLNPEQEKYVNWAINASGPSLLKGGPGTGKSTVALYRTRAILETLQNQGVSQPKILFTTYTNALISFSQQLLTRLLGDDVKYVDVKTADSIANSLIYAGNSQSEYKLATATDLRKLLKQALKEVADNFAGNLLKRQAQKRTLENLTVDYLIDEINSVIEAREITSLEDYQNTPRSGREISLNKTQRQAVWHLREHFYKLIAENNLKTWHQHRTQALDILREMENPPVYDAVIVDEAQDLDPNTLRLLTQLCRHPNRLFITADANQSIYGSSFRWNDIHQDLKFVGRTGILKVNHRTTREINEAAYSFLATSTLEDETESKNNTLIREYINNGPPPAVRAVTNAVDEAELLMRFCKTAAREFRLGTSACAILTPTEDAGEKIASQLDYLGLPATFMSSKNLDLNLKKVKVVTLKAAKGLEFPIVCIAGFLNAAYPKFNKNTPEDEIAEILKRERRSLFVGMTRAMRGAARSN
ncbi:AAA family ATPase [Plectonema cf. radiosum LEGE 06105]|uniref:DNA 3'-5' helicase n=1 Tax=Plectonema cf. radiosum LEGE 06105 TaxID=945769 RepID=A0A8J7EZ83_9CYAN|nr:UvrD-helicase domain-containing protein [Plectonema radiosum]MBE9212886.1 AAA family ATPase [Plectonema cf. radiosum LEGE 06105]